MNSWSNYIGQLVAGRYQLESLLGVGSFGAVYAATDRQTRQAIALRLLPPQIGGQVAFDSMSLTDFQHPNAVGVNDVGSFEETRYIAMPRITGVPIQVRDPWPVERVLEFVRQVSAPLIAFQKQFDLQHLHLHPGNVFVEEVAGQRKYQIADLGLASQIGAGQVILEAIREKRTTPEFLSPEQLQGNVPSSQSDVYAFGAMLFQLLAGLPPFPYCDESLSSYALHISKTPPPRFRNISDQLQIDEYVESIILRCLSKSPDGRPSSLQEFVESYEMAYRDFQSRTLSGMTVSSLNQLLAGISPTKDLAQSSQKLSEPKPEPERKPAPPIPPSSGTLTSKSLPASDMLAQAPPQPDRNNEIPYRAYPHGTDTNMAMSLGSIGPSPMLEESEDLIQTLNPQLSPWLGMGSQPQPPPTVQSTLPPNALKNSPINVPGKSIETSRPQKSFQQANSSPVTPVEQGRKTPLETLPPRAAAPRVPEPRVFEQRPPEQRAYEQRQAELRPPTSSMSAPSSEPPRSSDSTPNRGGFTGADQTLSPSSQPPAQAASSPVHSATPYGGQAASSQTMLAQQDWLKQQMQSAPVIPQSPMLPRRRPKKSRAPVGVVILVVAFVAAGLGVLGYDKSVASRTRQEVAALARKGDYVKALASLKNAKQLVGLSFNRDEEISQLLNDGLKEVERRESEDKLAEAVLLTGQLDLAFAEESGLSNSAEPKKRRQAIADGVKKKALEYARSQRLKLAVDELDSDVSDIAAAFDKVAALLAKQQTELNVRQIKRSIFEIGVDLANDAAGNSPKEALEVLDKWKRAFLTDDDISDEQKQELKQRHCQARVKVEMGKAKEEIRLGATHFPAAIAMLDQLLDSLQDGGCSIHRPSVLMERSSVYRNWATTKDGTENDSLKRFELSLNDLNSALKAIDAGAGDVSVSGGSEANVVRRPAILESLAETFAARGQWYESQATAERSTSLLLKGVHDFKAALKENAAIELPKTRLQEIREAAQAAAYTAYQSAQTETGRAAADEQFCEASRQLTLVIETNTAQEDDGVSLFARLLRGLAQSSLRAPDYAPAIADLTKAAAQATPVRVTEIGKRLLPESSSQDRDFQLRHLFAIGRSRLAWLVSTCYLDEIRNDVKGTVKAHEHAQQALAALEEMVDQANQNEKLRDELRRDSCSATEALIVSLADMGQFDKAKVYALGLQGKLDPNAKGWEADERNVVESLLNNYIEKKIPYRASAPQGVVRSCLEK